MHERNWQAIGEPVSGDEAEALDALRGLLPDDELCHAWSNLAFQDRTGHVNEIDVLLLTRKGLFVVELKGWRGHVSGRNNEWYVGKANHRDRRGNPVVQTDMKAKRLKGMLQEAEDEARTRVRIPYIAPVVVMHGRSSDIELSEQTKGSVFGLDRYGVKGVPAFTELLRRPTKGAPLDKPTCDALVRLIRNSGLAPRLPSAPDELPVASPGLEPAEAAVSPDATGTMPTDSLSDSPVTPTGLFDELTDDQLVFLGVSAVDLPRVRAAANVETLIGRIPDELWDDLEAVAGGEPIDDVVERRWLAQARFADVAEQADAMGWVPEPVDSGTEPVEAPVEPDPAPLQPPVEPPLTDLERQLREAFGDRVTSPSTSHRKEPKKASAPVKPAERPSLPEPTKFVVPAETLLTIARTEALAGRVAAAQALHNRVRARLEDENTVDWLPAEVSALARSLDRFPPLSLRLEQLADDLHSGQPRAPVLRIGPQASVGSIWSGHDLGPAYSLLLRVPDVLDRRSGLFLSQVIGPAAAASVNARLRIGRPDGGRIRIAADGTVVSRRDAQSPWFVVGSVAAGEWFPAEQVLAA